jgi:S-adenosylmethionine synthetase
MSGGFMKTAECVAPGHPDKVCDQISDAILDECLRQDPKSRVAIETMGGHGVIAITGELTTKAYVNMNAVARDVYRQIGYTDEVGVIVNVVSQSPDISQGVDTGGAGDQGIMVGYATSANKSMIPQELHLAREILKNLPKEFGPDAKSQVTLDDQGDVETIVISAQHKEGQSFEPLKALAAKYKAKNIFVNPTGAFVLGGFTADTGLTGRKLIVDNYGPQVTIGGGCYSGKDPSKVDRSAAYMARRVACDFVRDGYDEATVKIAYSIGVAEPVMATAHLKAKGVDEVTEVNILKEKKYDLRPKAIIEFLDLRKPQYLQTAAWGHFGHGFKWD